MSSAAYQQRILIVSQRHDDPVRAAASLLGQAGAAVTVSPDPYHALAQLVQGPGFAHLLLDIRDMDEAELGIVNIASRYCPTVACAALVLPGVESRLSRHTGSIRMIDSASLAARIGDGGRPPPFATANSEGATELPPGDDGSIEQTFGVREPSIRSDESESAPVAHSPHLDDPENVDVAATSSYEAVRTRMRDGAAPPIRRRPGDAGQSTAFSPDLSADRQHLTETGVELTAAEIDALLAIDSPPHDRSEEAAP